jgi:hypothetical protein
MHLLIENFIIVIKNIESGENIYYLYLVVFKMRLMPVTRSIKNKISKNQKNCDMEVHHHPDIRKKNFREYVFEGLMIFMAVTLGFFAERLREDMAEHSREKEFIVSMVEDAQLDIFHIDKSIALNKIRVLKLDTLANICFNYGTPGNNDAGLYKVIRYCIKHPDFVCPVERTMFQLKNAGGMRLIQKKEAVDSIIFYDDITKKMLNQQDYYELHLKILLDATEQMFDLKCFPLNTKTLKWEFDPELLATGKLISHDKIKIIELGNKAKIFQGIVMFYLDRLGEAKLHASNLINTLEKEYYLK